MGSINGTAVRGYRRLSGRTVAELAKELGISAGHLSRIETGGREPGVALVLKIASTLDVEIGQITYPLEMAVAS